ncbi:N5-glutamine methyltransferase family protein [Boudabousia marimammalium]|uniref:peptide chain release factor N(5)-glutamine methyltransferase n=1 Tax=Boudabousia marimammalium TaxID=156892 RepID=A0A1Q5PRY2_9ACTO|nr:HemK/PrmC family methyltransferase [Boudabousia marimammalium]OKL50170.1 hypothetical protein BM477_01885 [Boudabousia marimammalium]
MSASSLRSLLIEAEAALASAGYPSAAVEAKTLAEYVLQVEHLVLAPPTVGEEQTVRMRELVAARIAGKPIQLLTGDMYFRHLRLKAREGVFIVRPETEMVVESAIAEARRLAAAGKTRLRIMDLCTGSGAIAIALQTELRALGLDPQVAAVEISAAARQLAAQNADQAGAEILIRDEDVTVWRQWWQGESWDLIVSNPPYVPAGVELPVDVIENDPHAALFGGGVDGMQIPHQIIDFAAQALVSGGALVMEHDDTQGKATRETALQQGFSSAETGLDLAGRDRFLLARR